jgi:hypothetical protein
MAQLEEESGESSSPRHETFSGSSSLENETLDEDVESMTSYQPTIEKKHVQKQVPLNPIYTPTPIVDTPAIVTPTPNINYNQDNSYVRSESIMDTFKQKNTVDLNSINTGIEYSEGTTFTNIEPSVQVAPTKRYATPTTQKFYSIQLASSSSQNRINRILSNLPASMRQNIRIIKVGNEYKALALNESTVRQAKSKLPQYRSYVPDAFIKATYPLNEERL